MSLITSGIEIIFKRVSGKLIRYREGITQPYPKDSILYGEKLSNELAISAVQSCVRGVITKKSSFSTHGANILRGSLVKIAWITNVEIEVLCAYEGKNVYMDLEGRIFDSIPIEKGVQCNSDISLYNDIQYKFGEIPINDTSIIDWNLKDSSEWICYWKYNFFSKYIFSSLKIGIQKEFKNLFGYKPSVRQTEDGRIWIETDLLHSQILHYCNDSEWLISYLAMVHEKYDGILLQMNSNQLTMEMLQKWFVEYYSCFTMIHRSYENVLFNFYEKVHSQFGGAIAIDLMDCFMTSKIDKWIVENSDQINNSKKFLIEETIVPLPCFSIKDDIGEAKCKVKRYFEKLGMSEWYIQENNSIRSVIELFVLKEWKFIMYKLLTSRCYYYFSSRKNVDMKIIAERTYDEVLKLYGDEKISITN